MSAFDFWAHTFGNSTRPQESLPEAQERGGELHLLHGLDPAAPLVVTPTSRTAGAVVQTVVSDGLTETVQRV